MDIVGVAFLILMAGTVLLLFLAGLAICLGYVRVSHYWVEQQEQEQQEQPTSGQEPVEQLRLQSARTQQAMDEETKRYLEELYQTYLSQAEAEYRLPTMRAPAKEHPKQPVTQEQP